MPAGTHVVVKTTATNTSVDATGTKGHAVLARPLSSNGRVVVPAGANVLGRVVTSRRQYHSKDRLTVDIIEIVVNGRSRPIRTTGAFFVDNLNMVTRTGAVVTRGGYAVRAGRLVHFHLAAAYFLAVQVVDDTGAGL